MGGTSTYVASDPVTGCRWSPGAGNRICDAPSMCRGGGGDFTPFLPEEVPIARVTPTSRLPLQIGQKKRRAIPCPICSAGDGRTLQSPDATRSNKKNWVLPKPRRLLGVQTFTRLSVDERGLEAPWEPRLGEALARKHSPAAVVPGWGGGQL